MKQEVRGRRLDGGLNVHLAWEFPPLLFPKRFRALAPTCSFVADLPIDGALPCLHACQSSERPSRNYRGHRIVVFRLDETWHAIVYDPQGSILLWNIKGRTMRDAVARGVGRRDEARLQSTAVVASELTAWECP
jgi:hypothetical protein